MTVTVREVLKADLVLVGAELLTSEAEIRKFRDSIGVTVHIGAGAATDAATGVTHPVAGLALQRERIIFSSFPGRTIVVKEYPSLVDPQADWSRLAEVVALAIETTDSENINIRSFGYNFGFVLDVDSEEGAPHFVGTRMLTDRPLGNAEWGLIGGAAVMMFDNSPRRWTFNLQPQPIGDPSSKLVTFDVNLHVDEARTPGGSEIEETLNEIWAEAHAFVGKLQEVEQVS
jgi:hypothetical protein